jgi:pyruvate ferredoxin oxidoreductase alpha subunit
MNNKKQILEGSHAIALAIQNIEPAVISAYPITPQTHIVEDLAKLKADGKAKFEYIRAESEFAAASIVLGASAAGSRVYSATSSQGLLLMTEVLYNISGMRLPVVMTCANRAISAPINIWCDHSDVMSVRDAGWIQLFAADHQEAVDSHILAYKLAEKLNLPVMINVDGFILTHSYETVIIPTAKEIKKYLPKHSPKKGAYLDPNNPATMGAFFPPSHYMETRESLHEDLKTGLKIIKDEYKIFKKIFKNKAAIAAVGDNNGLIGYYGPKNPETILVAMGSMVGTVREAIKKEKKVGLLKISCYRPFPAEEINRLIKGVKNIAVLEKAVSPGQFGPLYSDLKAGLGFAGDKRQNINNYIVGLGGRDVTQKMIEKIIKDSNRQNNSLKFIGK